MTTRTILTTAALALSLSLTACGHTRIEEDQPGWDCHTMGNHVCGDNATAPLPHQDVPGFYTWDGDEWVFNPA
jgi:hypothetical protein